MKRLISMLAATLVAGLITYTLLELTGRLRLDLTGQLNLSISGRVSLPVWLFVVQMFVMGMLTSALAVFLKRLLQREEKPPESR
ncbi:MAG: hypothetical protein KJ645_05275 [Planctomycetes bacterium]|nr:hypothetical protein [Planctomycetota bacterium]